MNVKPGDVAKIVGDDLGNREAQVFVEALDTETSGKEVRWWVEALEPIKVYRAVGDFRVKLANPGAKLTAMDRYLRRVDPPADDAEDETVRELVTVGPAL